MDRYLHIIQEEISTVTKDDLYAEIKNTSLNSLDLLMIRGALERHFNFVIPDEVWYSQSTLEESLRYFHNNCDLEKIVTKKVLDKISISDTVEIRMPQMANEELSESWLLKYLGDFHWNLITRGFEKQSSSFADANGNRLYATFVRINYELTALKDFGENEVISFGGKIDAFGKSAIRSEIYGESNQNKLQANLLTVFSVKSESVNVIDKARLDGLESKIPQLNKTDSFISDYNLVKKEFRETLETKFGNFPLSNSEVIFEKIYQLNPFTDINGVGLLYFASYPMISDFCLLSYPGIEDFSSYSTVYRDIFYFGNCNRNDKIIFKLNFIDCNDEGLRLVTSLYRLSDNVLIAKIITVKK